MRILRINYGVVHDLRSPRSMKTTITAEFAEFAEIFQISLDLCGLGELCG